MSLWALARLQMDQSSKKADGPNPNDLGFFITSKRHCSWEALIKIQGLMLGNSTKHGRAKAQKYKT